MVYVASAALIVAGVTLVTGAAFYGFGSTGQPPDPAVLFGAAVASALLIVGGTVYRTATLSTGGARVATELGGVKVPADVTDPLRRRLRNVVEEMAIASGVPVPEIYVLEKEPGINAFAAGYTPGDAAVAVTRGTLELLDREELQGVIAHEFSHVLNGDMRLNIRMMGVLFGIMVISLVGRMILRGGYHGGSRRNSKSAGGIVILGLGLTILGWIGVFCARLIKAAVSRQREYLADASAVQFTRQTDGIANALKKIGGYNAHSYIQESDAEQISHMLFAHGAKFSSLFATHPPLTERIQALEPSFQSSQYPDVQLRSSEPAVADGSDARVAGFSSASSIAVAPETIIETVGQPGPAHVAYATTLRRSIPKELRAPAHSPSRAYLIALALLLDPDQDATSRQLEFLRQQVGDDRTQLIKTYYDTIRSIGPAYRLPLLEISFPALKLSPAPQIDYLLDMGRRLIEFDGRIDLREFCYYRILAKTLAQAAAPRALARPERATRRAVREAAGMVLRLLADRGHESNEEKEAAFRAGMQLFGSWAESVDFGAPQQDGVAEFEASLAVLDRMNSKASKTMLQAVTTTVAHDGRVSLAEAEMVRAICASLDCPLPPLLGDAA